MVNHIKISAKELYCVAVAALIMLAGATGSRANPVPVNANSIVQDGIEYYIQTDKAVYDLGQDVEMLYRVTNLRDVSVNLGTLGLDPPDYYDLRIMQEEDQIWWYPYTRVTGVIRNFILQPLETNTFQTNWNMMNDNGTPWLPDDDFLITQGTYDLVGEVALFVVDERVPVSVSIDVIPEPTSLLLLGTGMSVLLVRRRNKN